MTQENLEDLLAKGCDALHLSLTPTQTQQLISYIQTLHQWNQAYNLTAVRQIEVMMQRHVIDSLSILKSVQSSHPKQIADIGSGAGIPGIVLAIMLPETEVFLIESIGKKCRFLRHVTTILALSERVQVIQQRVEQWQPEKPLSMIICRAFTALENFTKITQHLGDDSSTWLAMKTLPVKEEVQQLPENFILKEQITLTVPYEPARRCLLVLQRRYLP